MLFFSRVYDYDEKLEKTFDSLLEFFDLKTFDKNIKIFIKLNLLTFATPKQCITTNPKFFEYAVKSLKKLGFNNLYAGDSPGIGTSYDVAKKNGIIDICEKYGVKFLSVEKSKIYFTPEPIKYEFFNLWDKIEDFSLIVNLPKLKTHSLMFMTLSVKNFYGLLPGKTNKIDGHLKSITHEEFAVRLIDLYSNIEKRVKVLNIIDGIYSMEGNGPFAGECVNTGAVFASFDAYETDFTVVKWLNFSLKKFPLYAAYKKYVKNMENVVEKNIKKIGKYEKRFKPPVINDVGFNVPIFIRKIYNGFFYTYPVIKHDKCIKCYRCLESCPPKTIIKNDKNFPVIKYGKCIKCFCCHEVCPAKTIEIKESFPLFVLNKIVYVISKIFNI